MTIRVLVNAAGSSSGGGRTYVAALIDELRERGARGLIWDLIVEPRVLAELPDMAAGEFRVRALGLPSAAARVVWEQTALPVLHAGGGYHVLFSVGNFGPLLGRGPAVLLAQNALHFSGFQTSGHPLRPRVESALARASVRRSRVVLTATHSMADAVERRTGVRPLTIKFGPGLARERVATPDRRTRFLHRTHWGPHKRLGELLEAVRIVSATHGGRFLVQSACDPFSDFARAFRESRDERRLARDSHVANHITFASYEVPAGARIGGDAVVMPSTLESFCFPLAEGVSLGIPIVAADSAVARELCGPSAFYYAPGDVHALAGAMRRIIEGDLPPAAPPALRGVLSWTAHVDRLANLFRVVAEGPAHRAGRLSRHGAALAAAPPVSTEAMTHPPDRGAG